MAKNLFGKIFSFKKQPKAQILDKEKPKAEEVSHSEASFQKDFVKKTEDSIKEGLQEQEAKEDFIRFVHDKTEETTHNDAFVEQAGDFQAQHGTPQKETWLEKLRSGLTRSSRQLSENISAVFTKSKLTQDALLSLEDVLLQADLGLETSMKITEKLATKSYGHDVTEKDVREIMAEEIENILSSVAIPLELHLSHKPHVILLVGVNGTGKTTTIGKLASKLKGSGLKVMLAAGDTFRAAAIEQLHIWGERIKVPVISSKAGADAAGLAFEAYQKAKQTDQDVLIIDTAGRLQNKAELMEECAKIVRVLKKHDNTAPHTVLQTLDATTGQNALRQVEVFQEFVGVNGLVMTKLDGTARGGILVAIAAKFGIPVHFIGVGEGVSDLEPFSAKEFAKAITNL